MEHIESYLSPHKFVKNLQTLRRRVSFPLPSDEVIYQCSVCDIHFPLSSSGIISLPSTLMTDFNHDLKSFMNELLEKRKEEKSCAHEDIKLDNQPENLLVSFKESDASSVINTITLGSCQYEPILLFTTDIIQKNDFLAIFQNTNTTETSYADFIKLNLHTFLNLDQHSSSDKEDSPVFDDQTLSLTTHPTLRLKGGGRKLHEQYNYSCLWCPQEVIKSGTKGKFKEYRTYLSHFKKIHIEEGVQMSEFEEKVARADPKWLCPTCQTYYSLGHSNNHRLNCQPSNVNSSAMVDETSTTSKRKEEHSGTHKRKPSQSPSPDGLHSQKIEKVTATYERSCQTDYAGITKECQTERSLMMQYDDNQEVTKVTTKEEYGECINKVEIKVEINPAEVESCTMDQEEEEKVKIDEEKPMVKLHYDVEDELWKENILTEKEIKAECIESIMNPPQINNQKYTFTKWWTKLPKDFFTDKGRNGPKIFCTDDTEEFIQKCLARHKEHELEKLRLDNLMLEAESETAKERLFSKERDYPFLDKYEKFVRTSSKKDGQNIFTEEYELLNIARGSKAKTGELYRNRILEFFKFMAKRFDNFHFDWMTDYGEKIEKNGRNGQKTKELFLPTKEELRDFVKQFKYGGDKHMLVNILTTY